MQVVEPVSVKDRRRRMQKLWLGDEIERNLAIARFGAEIECRRNQAALHARSAQAWLLWVMAVVTGGGGSPEKASAIARASARSAPRSGEVRAPI